MKKKVKKVKKKKKEKKAKKAKRKKADKLDDGDDSELGAEVSFRSIECSKFWGLQKGSGWLVGDYVFVRNLESDNRIFLKCQQNKKGCRATAVIDKVTNTAYNRQMTHNHEAPSRKEYKHVKKDLTVTSDGETSIPSSLSSLEGWSF